MLTKEIVLEAILKCADSTYTADLAEVSKELGVDNSLSLKPIYDVMMDIGYITMSLCSVTITTKGLKEIQK